MIIITRLFKLITLQLFLTLFSLPILFWWGLPVSFMSIIGNIVFMPFLIIFLFLSTVLFITELLFIPNYLIIILIEKVTSIWLLLVNLSSPKWLFFLDKIPKITNIISILLLILLFSFFFYYKNFFKNRKFIITIIIIFFISIFIYFGFRDNIEIDKITDKKKLIIDKSFEIKRAKLVDFGQIICVIKPSTKTLRDLTFLCSQIEDKELIFNSWQPSRLKKSGWKAWEELLYVIKKNQIKLSILK